ncbi:MAG: HAMP domain-containing protein [Nitrospirae bacterium]|nr:HAMP domain-containing protein [Nitrospirota bacterium]
MKIRRKLLIAFSIYMILALIPAVFSYRELNTLRKRLKPVETAGDITNSYLEVRKNEKTFLLLKDRDTLQLLKKQVGMLKGGLDDIEADVLREIGETNYASLRQAISAYEAAIQKLADNFNAEQFTTNKLTEIGRRIEKVLSGSELQTFLVLRRHEKNLIIQRDSSALDVFRQTYSSLQSSPEKDFAPYSASAEQLFRLYQDERLLEDEIRQAASIIQTYTDTILQGEREDIDSLLKISMNLLLASLAIVIVIGTLINARLAAHIAAPIREIRKFAERVAGGDFSQTLEVKGSQEFVSLGDALNQMAIKLKDTVSSLELAIRNLHDKQGQLVEAEKLASLGRIAAGVAHEINNPLAIINEKAGLMQDLLSMSADFEQKQSIFAQIEGITGSVNRCRTITHRLLGFARRMDITIEPLNLNEAIKETITFLRTDILTKSARLELNLAEDLPEIRSDKIQMEQVFLNLIKNAIDAVENSGQIAITTSRKDEGSVQVFISDNGSGIAKDKLNHIFEPFFTTKERGKGTGLGLFVSHAILRKLGSRIQVQSEPGKGTTFTLDIPIRPTLPKEPSV